MMNIHWNEYSCIYGAEHRAVLAPRPFPLWHWYTRVYVYSSWLTLLINRLNIHFSVSTFTGNSVLQFVSWYQQDALKRWILFRVFFAPCLSTQHYVTQALSNVEFGMKVVSTSLSCQIGNRVTSFPECLETWKCRRILQRSGICVCDILPRRCVLLTKTLQAS